MSSVYLNLKQTKWKNCTQNCISRTMFSLLSTECMGIQTQVMCKWIASTISKHSYYAFEAKSILSRNMIFSSISSLHVCWISTINKWNFRRDNTNDPFSFVQQKNIIHRQKSDCVSQFICIEVKTSQQGGIFF